MTALNSYFLTSLAGVDWMMSQIADHRRYEMSLELAEEVGELEDCDEDEASSLPIELQNVSDRGDLRRVAQVMKQQDTTATIQRGRS